MHQFGLSQLKGSTENNSKVVDAEPQSVDTEIVSLEGFTPLGCGRLLPLLNAAQSDCFSSVRLKAAASCRTPKASPPQKL